MKHIITKGTSNRYFGSGNSFSYPQKTGKLQVEKEKHVTAFTILNQNWKITAPNRSQRNLSIFGR